MNIKKFISRAKVSVAYDEDAKRQFHSEAEKVLRALAVKLGYQDSDYDLRHNQGGIAVSGEITLHSDTLYVQFSQTCLGPDWGFMWRTCKNRRDFVGGPNRWMKWELLADLDNLGDDADKSMVMNDGNMGCPHEEGQDFPHGEDCPFCPFWKGKQGSGADLF